MLGHRHHRALHRFLQFLALQRLIGEILRRAHEIHELAALIIPGIDRGLKRISGPPRLAADQVARLVGRDGKQPRAEAPLRIELLDRLVNLEKRLLEDVFGRGPIAEETHEEVEQLALVPADECRERVLVAGAIAAQELLIGAGIG